MSTDKSIPRVPDLHDPQPETPVTKDFETGTANDPDVGTDTDGPTTLTVDGEPVTVAPGSTIIDALQDLDDDIVSVDPGAEASKTTPTCQRCVTTTAMGTAATRSARAASVAPAWSRPTNTASSRRVRSPPRTASPSRQTPLTLRKPVASTSTSCCRTTTSGVPPATATAAVNCRTPPSARASITPLRRFRRARPVRTHRRHLLVHPDRP